MNSHLYAVPATPFTPEALRSALPPFSFGTPLTRDALFQAYRSYYHLNFEHQIPGLKVQAGQVHVGGFDIVVQCFVPAMPRATVLLVHGYYDHVGIFDHVIDALLQRDFAVLTFDLPGHGLSSGPRATIYNFHQYQPVLQKLVRLAQGQLPKPWHFVAQSTGAAIVSEYLLNFTDLPERLPFTSAVLMAPLVRPVNWWLNRRLHAVMAPWKDYVPRKYKKSSSDPAFLRFTLDADPLQPRFLSSKWVGALKQWIPFIERHAPLRFPVLMIQGEDDRTVDWRHNTAVLKSKFLPSEVYVVPAMRHQVVNEAAGFRAQVFKRMNHFLLAHSG